MAGGVQVLSDAQRMPPPSMTPAQFASTKVLGKRKAWPSPRPDCSGDEALARMLEQEELAGGWAAARAAALREAATPLPDATVGISDLFGPDEDEDALGPGTPVGMADETIMTNTEPHQLEPKKLVFLPERHAPVGQGWKSEFSLELDPQDVVSDREWERMCTTPTDTGLGLPALAPTPLTTSKYFGGAPGVSTASHRGFSPLRLRLPPPEPSAGGAGAAARAGRRAPVVALELVDARRHERILRFVA